MRFKSWIVCVLWLAMVAMMSNTIVIRAAETDKLKTLIQWCTINGAEQAKCMKLREVYQQIEKANVTQNFGIEGGINFLFHCVEGQDVFDCMYKIDNNEADLMTLDSGQGYFAGRYHNMMPLMAEGYTSDPNDPLTYLAVAIFKSTNRMVTLSNLSALRSCHAGIGTSAGWVFPMGLLYQRDLIRVQECNAPVTTISQLFSKGMCLPGSLNSFFNPYGNNPVAACSLCAGIGDEWCSSRDSYSGYDGALRCLASGAGDIAFVRDISVQQWADYTGSGFSTQDYSMLCPNGQRMAFDVQNMANCNWGKDIPSHIVMTSSVRSNEHVTKYKEFIQMISGWFEVGGPQASRQDKFKLFDSKLFSGHMRGNLMFTDGTQRLVEVGELKNSYYKWMADSEFQERLDALKKCPVGVARWCVITEQEKNKCEDMMMAFRAKGFKPDLDCVLADNTKQCMQMIRFGDADLVTLDAGDVYFGGKNYDLVPIAREDYGDMTGSFYVVAAARKTESYMTLFNLKGKRSCQGGVRTGDGWIIPASVLIETTQIRPTGCDIYARMGELFSRSCIPGALEAAYNPAQSPINLCEACSAGGHRRCLRNSLELYYRATGAFRCLVENGGDVAFVRHTTVRDNTDGRNQAVWSRNRRSDDYEIMCKDGSRQAIDQWHRCNLGRVPGNAIVTSKHKTAQERQIYWDVLNYAQMFFSSDKNIRDFSMFDSGIIDSDLMFTDSAVRLLHVPEEKQDYKEYLGSDFYTLVENLEQYTCIEDDTAWENYHTKDSGVTVMAGVVQVMVAMLATLVLLR